MDPKENIEMKQKTHDPKNIYLSNVYSTVFYHVNFQLGGIRSTIIKIDMVDKFNMPVIVSNVRVNL